MKCTSALVARPGHRRRRHHWGGGVTEKSPMAMREAMGLTAANSTNLTALNLRQKVPDASNSH